MNQRKGAAAAPPQPAPRPARPALGHPKPHAPSQPPRTAAGQRRPLGPAQPRTAAPAQGAHAPADARTRTPPPPRVQAAPGARAVQRSAPAGVVQRFAWAILDSRANDDDPEIVRTNVRNAAAYYGNRVGETTDPGEHNVTPINLNKGEPLHIHGHGTNNALAGFSAASLAAEVKRKFTAPKLRGRTIMLHACEVGSGQYLKDFLKGLAGGNNYQGWDGTKIVGPTNYLVVNDQGISQVAKEGVKAKDLKTRAGQRNSVMKKGEGWRGIEVYNGVVRDISEEQMQRVVLTAMKYKHS